MKRFLFSLTVMLCLFAVQGNAQSVKEMELWSYGAPNKNGDPRDTAKVWVYIPDRKIATGRAIVICPGGGYTHLALDKEGKEWGKRCQQMHI
jgi:acetyl esterase/lipase